MINLNEFLTIALINFLAVVSPGPDFALITRNSLLHSRRAGIYSALGLGLGILVHVTYSIIGVGFIISQSPLLFNLIKYIGAGYLLYIGYLSLADKRYKLSNQKKHGDKETDPGKFIRMGFITNITNPKATLFFLSLFTVVIQQSTPVLVKSFYGITMSLITFSWFAFVSIIFSHKFIKDRITKIQFIIEKVMGIILILLALKILFIP